MAQGVVTFIRMYPQPGIFLATVIGIRGRPGVCLARKSSPKIKEKLAGRWCWFAQKVSVVDQEPFNVSVCLGQLMEKSYMNRVVASFTSIATSNGRESCSGH